MHAYLGMLRHGSPLAHQQPVTPACLAHRVDELGLETQTLRVAVATPTRHKCSCQKLHPASGPPNNVYPAVRTLTTTQVAPSPCKPVQPVPVLGPTTELVDQHVRSAPGLSFGSLTTPHLFRHFQRFTVYQCAAPVDHRVDAWGGIVSVTASSVQWQSRAFPPHHAHHTHGGGGSGGLVKGGVWR